MSLNHPVLNLIRDRQSKGDLPGLRTDSFKLGLAVEGGGMRGVVSTAMASALHYLGLVNVFDAVYGSSSGAITGSFFVTHNMPLGPPIFYEHLNNSKFIDPKWMLLPGRSVMNLDYLLDDVLTHRVPMDWKGVLESKIPLKIIVSSLTQRKALWDHAYESREELFTLLKASATIPFVAGPPVPYKGDLLFDASLYEAIPHVSAIADGCTHVLVLLTRPRGRVRDKPSFMEKVFVVSRLARIAPGIDEDYLARTAEYATTIESLLAKNEHSPSAPHLYSIQPSPGTDELPRLEKNKAKLLEGSRAGMLGILNALASGEDPRCFETLTPDP